MMRLLVLAIALLGLVGLAITGVGAIHDVITGPVKLTSQTSKKEALSAPASRDAIVEFKPSELSSHSQIASRPIFFEGRRIPKPHVEQPRQTAAPEPISPPVPVVSADRLRLHGVHVAQAGRRALLSVSDVAPEWRKEGDAVEGWTVITIDAAQVHLRNGGQSATLRLYLGSGAD